MFDVSSARITRCVVHRVGNRLREEGCELSSTDVTGTADLHGTLLRHYLAPLAKGGEEFEFYHESDISLNAVRQFSARTFDNPDEFIPLSQSIARHLYAASNHPSIAGGEFIAILFQDIRINDEARYALGLYRIEQRETFLDVERSEGGLNLIELNGIPVNSIQKGVLVIDSNLALHVKDSGTQQAKYWVESFLKARPRQTEKSTAKLAASFVKQVCARIDVESGVSLRRDLEEVMSLGDSLLYSEVEEVSQKYLQKEEVNRLTRQLEEQSGFSSLSDSPVNSAMLIRQAKSVMRQYPLGDGVGVAISNPRARLDKCSLTKTKSGFRAVIDIELED